MPGEKRETQVRFPRLQKKPATMKVEKARQEQENDDEDKSDRRSEEADDPWQSAGQW